MTLQDDLREHQFLVVARKERETAIVEAEMSYITTIVHSVARKVGFLTRADVQALEQNLVHVLNSQLEDVKRHLSDHETRLSEVEALAINGANLDDHKMVKQRVDSAHSRIDECVTQALDLTNYISRQDGRIDHAHNRYDIINERVGRLELVLNALGKVLNPNS